MLAFLENKSSIQVKKANESLKSIVTREQGKKDTDLIKYVKKKMQIQSELIAAILEKIEQQGSR